tara:strand:+ start:6199 stop:7353 length:1155 start_codon:yes stop_codon:yes gene_type:complete
MLKVYLKLYFYYFGSLSNRRFSPYNLKVYQYFPDYFYKRPRVEKTDFLIDIFDLSYATARTICSHQLNNKELYFDVIASFLSHLNFIETTSRPLLLSESRYQRLRDFSRTTRIGEMAQGLNVHFCGSRLNFPFIIDFDLAKNHILSQLNIQNSGKSPDFLVINQSLDKIGLLESKGTMGGVVSGKSGYLSGAMEQIDAVENPCFDYNIPICIKFENNNDVSDPFNIPTNKVSSVNYSVLENECADPKVLTRLFKLHYASWFYLVGDFERVNELLESGTITSLENDTKYEIDRETDAKNPIYWLNSFEQSSFISKNFDFSLTLFNPPIPREGKHYFRIGIYKSVADNLVGEVDDGFPIPEVNNINYLKQYPDGTLLFIRISQKLV